MKKGILVLLVLFSAATLFSQTKQARFQNEIQALNSLLQQGKYKESIPLLESINRFRPNTYSVIYNLAACYAVTGNQTEAFRELEYLISIDTNLQFDSDSDFVKLKPNKRYSDILALRNTFDKFIAKSSDVVSFSDSTFHPENADYDPESAKWYSGSIRNGKIYEFDQYGNQTVKRFDFPSQIYSVFCVRLSSNRKKLFAAASVSPYHIKPNTEQKQQSALLIYDVESGKLESEIILNGDHTLGDLAYDKNGNLYLSDSRNPAIYEFDQKTKTFKEFISLPAAWNLQGLTFSSDFQFLFVADYISGVFKIDMKTKSVTEISNETNLSLKGIDGLLYYQQSLIAVQNGVHPKRIVSLHLNKYSDSITSVQTIEQNNPELDEPTNGMILHDEFFYLSNSPWGAYDRTFRFDESKSKRPAIKRIKLK